MNKWIEDLNMAIDMSKTQEKSDLLLDPNLCDRSNSKYLKLVCVPLFSTCAHVFFSHILFTSIPYLDVNPTPSVSFLFSPLLLSSSPSVQS